MDCLFGFLLLALMLFIFNRYLKIQRDGMSSCDVQNTTINKKTVLRNAATLEMIKDNLAKNMKRFEMFGKDILKNKQDNKNNEMLLETQVKQKEIQMKINEFADYIATFVKGNIPQSPRKGLGSVPQLKLVVEDLQAYYTETITYRDNIDDFEILGTWFWEKTKAGKMILALEAVSLESDNKILRQIVNMSLITPRFWSEGPLPGTSGSGW